MSQNQGEQYKKGFNDGLLAAEKLAEKIADYWRKQERYEQGSGASSAASEIRFTRHALEKGKVKR